MIQKSMNAKLKTVKGEFIRSESGFRNWVTKDGTAGPTGEAGFPAELGRYHLYVSFACPWAHRTLIFRALKGLEDANVMACAKHFPGHGDTDVDSHYDLPVINHDRERLDSLELFPFRINHGPTKS